MHQRQVIKHQGRFTGKWPNLHDVKMGYFPENWKMMNGMILTNEHDIIYITHLLRLQRAALNTKN